MAAPGAGRQSRLRSAQGWPGRPTARLTGIGPAQAPAAPAAPAGRGGIGHSDGLDVRPTDRITGIPLPAAVSSIRDW